MTTLGALAAALDAAAAAIPERMGAPDDQRAALPLVDLAIELDAASALIRAAGADPALCASAELFAVRVLVNAGAPVDVAEATLRDAVARRILPA